ncbi:MAG: AcvB/VirJ family lysyl-phosphatidylglycerol hydrolase [Gemmatimonadaceae bacterium]
MAGDAECVDAVGLAACVARRAGVTTLAFAAAVAAVTGCSGRHSTDASVADLPLVEVPATAPERGAFAVLMSGDGGWAEGDRGLASALAARGVPVAGLSAPRYLARERRPDESARDLARIISHYRSAWRRDSVIVIGYSRGADLVPFMVSRLPDTLRHRVALVALLGPSSTAGFQFHLVDLATNVARPGDLAVAPEVARLRGTPALCIYGRRDRSAICPTLPRAVARPVLRDGGHVVEGREGPALADTILGALIRPR